MPESDWLPRLHENVAQVRRRIADASSRAGRDPLSVRIVGVTKYVGWHIAQAIPAAGIPDLGENRVQQLGERVALAAPPLTDWPTDDATTDAHPTEPRPRWHMIGHLQRNKVKQLLPAVRIIHSLDSPRLAETLEHHAAQFDLPVNVLIEVNLAGEASKTGCPVDDVHPLARLATSLPHLRLRGLMTMAPFDPDPEHARPYFARLRTLLEQLRTADVVGPTCTHLSMGMSQDYEVAVEEGATLVRIGSALYENLPTADPRTTR